MLKDVTRSKLIQGWFLAVTLITMAGVVLGATVSIGTGVLLLALVLVPPMIVMILWPGVQPPTAAQVLHDVDGRR